MRLSGKIEVFHEIWKNVPRRGKINSLTNITGIIRQWIKNNQKLRKKVTSRINLDSFNKFYNAHFL